MTAPTLAPALEAVAVAPAARDCFHCGLPLPRGADFEVLVDDTPRPMCCAGCAAVAEAIVAAGHAHYYRARTELPPSPRDAVPELLRSADVFAAEPVARQFVRSVDAHRREASLILDGVTCAACIWLIERQLARLPGVSDARVNYATERAWIQWDERHLCLADILRAVERIGYRAQPCDAREQEAARARERRRQQRRLAVAGLFGMQVMMLSISLYAGAGSGIEREFEQLFRWLCLLLTLPVVGYSALPFFRAAARDLVRRQVSMDLPVALAILAAFGASVVNTVAGHGEIYFDSVVMFVFLLGASRYFERVARARCAAAVEKLAQSLPLVATRIEADGSHASVAASALAVGDRVLVRNGESVPADGELVAGETACDESLLTGESDAVAKRAGDRLFGGSINARQPVEMRVTAIGADTVLAEIRRLVERAQADKPPRARLADRIAARFIVAVLLLVAVVAAGWYLADSARAFEIALAVLIVSCPCALSLATPTALAAALGRLQADGLLVRNGDTLERLEQVTHVVFDKTGTLTHGKPCVDEILLRPGISRADALSLAAALERHSEHPLARALVARAAEARLPDVTDLVATPGGGIAGRIDGEDYCLGSVEFVAAQTGLELPAEWRAQLADFGGSAVVLARRDAVLAMFGFSDSLREDAAALIGRLRADGKKIVLLTGDRPAAAARVAAALGIDAVRAGLAPADKITAVAELQARGARVLMVGDGVNDAPVLARADVSIAMGGAAALAQRSADIVLLGDRLALVGDALARAARAGRVIRQNLAWALGYNLGAIPLAAAGLVAPWLAALGMSSSSLVVVMNALRLAR